VYICFHCDKEITSNQKKFMFGLDKPYVNIFFHRECFDSIKDLTAYFTENAEKVYNYSCKIVKKKEKS